MTNELAEYLEGGLTAVTCAGCGVTVRAKKNSTLHTSVQWNRDAVDRCIEFAQLRALGEPTALVRGCGRLLDTINGPESRLTVPATARQ